MYAAYRRGRPGHPLLPLRPLHVPVHHAAPRTAPSRTRSPCTLNVPMDDTHTMTYNLAWKKKTPPLQTLKNGDPIPGLTAGHGVPAQHQRLVRPLAARRPARERLLHRSRQAEERAATPASRASAARTRPRSNAWARSSTASLEHLAPSDRMIAITRKRLLGGGAEVAAATGRCRPRSTIPTSIAGARGGAFIASANLDWLDAYALNLRQARAARPAGKNRRGGGIADGTMAERLRKTAAARPPVGPRSHRPDRDRRKHEFGCA